MLDLFTLYNLSFLDRINRIANIYHGNLDWPNGSQTAPTCAVGYCDVPSWQVALKTSSSTILYSYSNELPYESTSPTGDSYRVVCVEHVTVGAGSQKIWLHKSVSEGSSLRLGGFTHAQTWISDSVIQKCSCMNGKIGFHWPALNWIGQQIFFKLCSHTVTRYHCYEIILSQILTFLLSCFQQGVAVFEIFVVLRFPGSANPLPTYSFLLKFFDTSLPFYHFVTILIKTLCLVGWYLTDYNCYPPDR